jgi:hypothetical protein
MKSTHVLLSDDDLALLEDRVGSEHPICKRIREAFADLDNATFGKYRAAAIAASRDGELEIDHGAVVSKGDDPGAYVMAWLWVTDEEAGIDDGADE